MDGSWQKNWYVCGIIPLACLAMSGCTTMQPNSWSLFGKQTAAVAAPAETGQTFVVELHSANGSAKTATCPWKPDMHVQEALQSVNGFRRFSRFNVELHRQLPQGGLHRMAVDYAKTTNRIEPEFDYVVHPGDKLVITETTETMLDDAINAVLGPVGLDRVLPSTRPKDNLPARYRLEG